MKINLGFYMLAVLVAIALSLAAIAVHIVRAQAFERVRLIPSNSAT